MYLCGGCVAEVWNVSTRFKKIGKLLWNNFRKNLDEIKEKVVKNSEKIFKNFYQILSKYCAKINQIFCTTCGNINLYSWKLFLVPEFPKRSSRKRSITFWTSIDITDVQIATWNKFQNKVYFFTISLHFVKQGLKKWLKYFPYFLSKISVSFSVLKYIFSNFQNCFPKFSKLLFQYFPHFLTWNVFKIAT